MVQQRWHCVDIGSAFDNLNTRLRSGLSAPQRLKERSVSSQSDYHHNSQSATSQWPHLLLIGSYCPAPQVVFGSVSRGHCWEPRAASLLKPFTLKSNTESVCFWSQTGAPVCLGITVVTARFQWRGGERRGCVCKYMLGQAVQSSGWWYTVTQTKTAPSF